MKDNFDGVICAYCEKEFTNDQALTQIKQHALECEKNPLNISIKAQKIALEALRKELSETSIKLQNAQLENDKLKTQCVGAEALRHAFNKGFLKGGLRFYQNWDVAWNSYQEDLKMGVK